MKRKTLLQLATGAGLVVSTMLAPRCAVAAPQVTQTSLDNGLRVVVVRDPLAPVVTTVLNYLAGSDDEEFTGTAHATEHMMFRGSKTLSASQFAQITAITGGNFNADTQNEVTQYFFTMPSTYLDVALQLEASRAHDVLDTQPLWDKERGAIEQEVTQDNSEADYRLYITMLHNILAGTPYANEGLGTVESFGKQINAPQLQAFYHAWYHPNNAILVISGDVDPATTIAKVKKYFGSIPSAPTPAHKPVQLQELKPATYREESDKPYTLVYIGYRFPGYQDPDYAASQVLTDVLNSQRADLYGLVAKGDALFTGMTGSTYPQAGLGLAYIGVPATTPPEDAAKRLQAVIEQYRQRGVPADLVEAAKLREEAADEYKGNSIQDAAFDWSTALAVEGRQSPEEDIEAIRKVTVEDVNACLRKYLVAETATLGFAVPNNKGAVSAGHGHAGENNTVVPTDHTPLPTWATDLLKHLQVPAETAHPTDMTLSNGIRLIVQPESITHTVVLSGQIVTNTGLQEAPQTEGVATLTEQLMPYGTTTYDRVGYQAELDKIAASVSTGTGFSLSCLSADFDRGVQLLGDDQLHPALKPDDFKVVHDELYEQTVGDEKAPDHLANVAMIKALYPPGDPSRRVATPETVKGLTLDNVKDWFQRAYRPDLTTIVVVGDITPDAARQTLEKYFGEWHAEGPKPNVDPPPAPPNPVTSVVIPDTGRVQCEVSLAETLTLTHLDPDYAPLQLANTVLSGGFYASLLYHDLREVHGYVYSVGSNLSVGRTRSTFNLNFGSDPINVNKAQQAAIEELRSLQKAPLPEERLQKAKALWMGEVPVREQSYDGVAGQLLQCATHNLPLDQAQRDAAAALRVTPVQLQEVLKKWVRPEGFVRVVKGPEPK